jgi:nucleoside-diphosphate-sugar epimerase
LLVARGYAVASFNRGHYPELDALGVRQIRGDLADADALREAARGMDAIFHNAAKAGAWGSYESYRLANVVGTDNVIAACRAHGIGKLVYTSTPSVTHRANHPVAGGNETDTPYGEHFKAAYPITKTIAEKAVLAANDAMLATVALRPRLIWGAGDNQLLPRLVARARAGRLRFVGDGNNLIDSTYIENAAQAHVDAFDHLGIGAACAGNPYFISNGDPRSVRETVNALLGAVGAPQVQGTIPFRVAYAVGAVLEVAWRALPLKGEPPMTRFLAEQLATTHWYDISAARRDFGYAPQVSFDEGLHRLAAAWDTRGSG